MTLVRGVTNSPSAVEFTIRWVGGGGIAGGCGMVVSLEGDLHVDLTVSGRPLAINTVNWCSTVQGVGGGDGQDLIGGGVA